MQLVSYNFLCRLFGEALCLYHKQNKQRLQKLQKTMRQKSIDQL